MRPHIISMRAQNKHIQQQRESHESSALHTVFTAPFNYWLVVFLCYERPPHRSAHKNCSRTLPFKPACTLLTPRPPSKTGHLLFLALSHSAAHCYCVLSLPLICLIYSHIPLPFHYPLPSSLTSSNFFGPGRLIKGDCRPCSAKYYPQAIG